MKRIVSILTFVLLAYSAATFSHAAGSAGSNSVVRLQSLILPEFKVKRVTLDCFIIQKEHAK